MSATLAPPHRLAVHRGRIWSTTVDLVVTDPDAIVEASRVLHDVLARVEAAASRFRPDSELNRVHAAHSGTPVVVSGDLLEALDLALKAAEATDGAVDPTVGAALAQLGYDDDFGAIELDQADPLPPVAPVPGWRRVHLDRHRSTVTLEGSVRLDLGATAKAWAADWAAAEIAVRYGCGVLVSLGGDLSVAGPAPDGGFSVGLADRCDDTSPGVAVAVSKGGLATSGIGRRTWVRDGHAVHHLVDPATGGPVDSPWRAVTATGATCVAANTTTTAAMVMGEPAAGWLEERGVAARLVRRDSRVVTVGDWPAEAGS